MEKEKEKIVKFQSLLNSMGKRLYSFEEPYSIRGSQILVKGRIQETDWGRPFVEIEYLFNKTIRKKIILLSGTSKNKLRNKIMHFLYNELKT